MVKWWDRLWGAVWIVGSIAAAYLTGRWFAQHAAPADLGALRYGLVAFSALFGLLVGALLLSIAVIGVTSGIEWLLKRAGYPLRPEPIADPARADDPAADEPAAEPVAAPTLQAPGHD